MDARVEYVTGELWVGRLCDGEGKEGPVRLVELMSGDGGLERPSPVHVVEIGWMEPKNNGLMG